LESGGDPYGKGKGVSETQGHRPIRQAVRHRRPGGHGPGPVLLPAHRHHRENPGRAAWSAVPGGGGGLRLRHERRGHGRGHRLGAEGAPHGAVFPGHGGLRRQRPGQHHPERPAGGRGAAGGAVYRHTRRRVRQSRLERNQGGHPGHPPGDDSGGGGDVRPHRPRPRWTSWSPPW